MSRLVNFEIPPGVYEVLDSKKLLTDLVRIFIVTEDEIEISF